LHNPDVHHPYINIGDKPLYCEGFIPVHPTLDVWAADREWVGKRLAEWLARQPSPFKDEADGKWYWRDKTLDVHAPFDTERAAKEDKDSFRAQAL
jgi:hypothetical protein